MATSFVEIGGRGFWVPDHVLEVWLYALGEALSASDESWAREYAEYLSRQATARMHGCIDCRLDAVPVARREELVAVACRAVEGLRNNPYLLSAERLNGLGLGGGDGTYADLPQAIVDACYEMFVGLLKGRVGWDAGDKRALPATWIAAACPGT
ncbi:hypothetical protein [Corallococcus sp. CA053C]|uniref:hypothetical protein n=1 Tax=Corallococcus sp. CA053C TaxID=2316732 RepID=UPI0011C476AE|nr:hypothetical protein [Corallococcus sp. CA053C]